MMTMEGHTGRRLGRVSTLLLLVLLPILVFAGCLSDTTASKTVAMNGSRLRQLLALYNSATVANRRPPGDEQQFKDFVSSRSNPKMLDRLGISSTDELFVSARDEKPFVFFYGRKPKGVHRDLVAYEQDGVDGKRWVGFQLGNIEEVDEQKFRELVPEGAAP